MMKVINERIKKLTAGKNRIHSYISALPFENGHFTTEKSRKTWEKLNLQWLEIDTRIAFLKFMRDGSEGDEIKLIRRLNQAAANLAKNLETAKSDPDMWMDEKADIKIELFEAHSMIEKMLATL